MHKLHFKVPTEDDIKFIAKHMRDGDVTEVLAAGSKSPYEAVAHGVAASKAAIVASHNGVPLVVFGFKKITPITDTGIIWMLGSTHSLRYRREFMHFTKLVLGEMFDECTILMNFVHEKNRVSVRWLRALGFTIDKAQPYGPANEPFHKFHMHKDNYNV